MDDIVGSITPGKRADLAAVDLGALDLAPYYDPVSHLVYVCGRDQVTDVWVDGRHVVRDRVLTTVELPAITDAVREWRDRIARTA